MRKKAKSVLSWLLLICMIVTMIPATAYATDEDPQESEVESLSQNVSVTYWEYKQTGMDEQENPVYKYVQITVGNELPFEDIRMNGFEGVLNEEGFILHEKSGYKIDSGEKNNLSFHTEYDSKVKEVYLVNRNENKEISRIPNSEFTLDDETDWSTELTPAASYDVAFVRGESNYRINNEVSKYNLLDGQESEIITQVIRKSYDEEKQEIEEDITEQLNYSYETDCNLVTVSSNGNRCTVVAKQIDKNDEQKAVIRVTVTDEEGTTIGVRRVRVNLTTCYAEIDGIPRFVGTEKSFVPKLMKYTKEKPEGTEISNIFFKVSLVPKKNEETDQNEEDAFSCKVGNNDANGKIYPANTTFTLSRLNREWQEICVEIYPDATEAGELICSNSIGLEGLYESIWLERIDAGSEEEPVDDVCAWEDENVTLQLHINPDFKDAGFELSDISIDSSYAEYDSETGIISVNVEKIVEAEDAEQIDVAIKLSNDIVLKNFSINIQRIVDDYEGFPEELTLAVGEEWNIEKSVMHYQNDKDHEWTNNETEIQSLTSSDPTAVKVNYTENEYRLVAQKETKDPVTITAEFSDGGERTCKILVVNERFDAYMNRTDGGRDEILPGETVTYTPEGCRLYTDENGEFQISTEGISFDWRLEKVNPSAVGITKNKDGTCTLKEKTGKIHDNPFNLVIEVKYNTKVVANFTQEIWVSDEYEVIRREGEFVVDPGEEKSTEISVVKKYFDENDALNPRKEEYIPRPFYWKYDASQLIVSDKNGNLLPTDENTLFVSTNQEPVTFYVKRIGNENTMMEVFVGHYEDGWSYVKI